MTSPPYYRRALTERLQFIAGLPILVVIGARRTGKTTLLRSWYEHSLSPRMWLDGDNPAHLLLWERLRSGQDSLSWLQGLFGADPAQTGTLLVLDEAQVLPQVSRLVKVLTDAHPQLQVVMSGSSALKLKDFTVESMAGRKQLLELFPLTLHERLSAVAAPLRTGSALPVLHEMLTWGGFPGVLSLPEGWQRTSYLTEVLDAALYRDLLSETRSRDVSLLKRLMVYLARSVGGKLNTSNLAGALELSRVTVSRYLDLLEEASFILRLPGVDARGVVPKAQPKIYLMDNGLLSMLVADDRPFELRRPEDQGVLLENFVVSELHKRFSGNGPLTQLGYHWDKHGEIDLVAVRNGDIQAAWEVKRRRLQGGSRATRDLLGETPLQIITVDTAAQLFAQEP